MPDTEEPVLLRATPDYLARMKSFNENYIQQNFESNKAGIVSKVSNYVNNLTVFE